MEQFAYYYGNKQVRISKKDYELLEANGYGVTKAPLWHDSNSGCEKLNELVLVIENDEKLCDKSDVIINRLKINKDKLTPSQSYYYDCVELKLVEDLLRDAKIEYNKLTQSDIGNLTSAMADEYLHIIGIDYTKRNTNCAIELREKLSKCK